MSITRPRRSALAAILLAVGTSVAGAGLYAAGLTVSTTGTLGAGGNTVPAACDDSITVTPGPTQWSPDYNAFVMDSLVLSGIAPACDGSILSLALSYEWIDTEAGQSGTDTLLIQSETVAADGQGDQIVEFLQSCDLDNDGEADPGCTPEPFPVAVDDFDDISLLIQDDPAAVDDPDAPGDVGA